MSLLLQGVTAVFNRLVRNVFDKIGLGWVETAATLPHC
jgi:hypothetical protein